MIQTTEPSTPPNIVRVLPRRRFPLLPILLLFVIVAGAGAAGFAIWNRRTPDPIQQAKQRVDQRRVGEQEKAKTHDQVQLAVTNRACQEAIDHGQKTLGFLADFDKELKQWNDSVATLLTDDRGKALAAMPVYIPQFRKLFQQRRPTKADGDAIGARVSTLLVPLRAALLAEHSTYTPTQEVLAALEADRTAALGLIDQYQKPRREIEALVAEAQRMGKPAAITLEQAIKDLDAQDADEQARTVAIAEEDARKEGVKRLAAARADKIRQDTEYQEKQIKAEKELDAARAESKLKQTAASREAEESRGAAEASRIREEARKKEMTRLAQSPEVKALLAPFTAPGYWQPGVEVGQSTDKKAVSLTKLRSFGALEDSPEGLQQLLTAGTGPYHRDLEDKVRPRWPWPSLMNALKPEELDQLKKAQKYLRDLDTTLVDLKMLSE